MSGDLEEAVRMLAADNARMCDIVIAADALIEAVKNTVNAGYMNGVAKERMKRALEAYTTVRNGN